MKKISAFRLIFLPYKKVDLLVTGKIEMWKALFPALIFLILPIGYKRTFGKAEAKIMEENRWEWKDFGKIRTCEDLEATHRRE